MWWKIAIAFLLSSIKYLLGVTAAMALHPIIGFIVCTSGGFAGCVVFVYGGLWIERKWSEWRNKKEKKKFTKTSRLLIKIKKLGGLWLIALLTPVFLSIPIGCIAATMFEKDRIRILRLMFVSLIVWGIIFFGIKGLIFKQ